MSKPATAIWPATIRPTPNLRPTYTPHPTAALSPTRPPTTGGLAPPPPPPTLKATQALTAAVDTTQPASFIQSMSRPERDCLGADITTDADLMAAVKDSPLTPADNIMDCLGDEGQFQLYMMSTEGTDELTEATHRCIWNAMLPLGNIASLADDESPEQAMALFGKLMMFMVSVPLYCAATEQPELAGLTHIEAEPNAAEFICMIDAAGGLDEWTRLILSENASFLDFIDAANQECAPAAP